MNNYISVSKHMFWVYEQLYLYLSVYEHVHYKKKGFREWSFREGFGSVSKSGF